MAIEKMNLLNVTFPHEKTFDMLVKIKNMTAFHPQKATSLIKDVKHVEVMPKDDSYDKILTRVNELSVRLGLELEKLSYHNERINVEKENQYLDDIEAALSKIEKVKKELEAEKDENDATQVILENIEGHELNLDHLFNSHYLKVRVGRIPTRDVAKLEYYDGYPFILRVYKETSQYTWCAYIAVNKDVLEIDNIFSSIGFERIRVPAFVHGTAKEALEEVKQESKAMDGYIAKMDQRISVLKEQHRLQLNELYTKAICLQDLYSIHECIIDYSNSAAVIGFVETDKLDSIRNEFEQIDGVQALTLPSNIYQSQKVYPPIIRKNNKIIKPFEKLAKVKQYEDVDSAPFIALLWMLSFGICLGDIALGAVLSVAGFLFAKKSDTWKIINRIGISTLIFGLLYGSAAYSNVYPAIISLPITLPMRFAYLAGSLVLGYWLVGCLCAIIKNVHLKKMSDVILGFCGVTGLIILLIVAVAAFEEVQFGQNILNLPLELVVAVAVVLTIFKNKIKTIFGKQNTA
ncbi:V-type ATP synthase subunit I [Beduini massiliensis]|uniref:hypothetical protein n=1 Tax=Beduini massiliensis TaxID=1585974 RepID=UPI00059AAD2E|nr:hypothetical protein [Beduini massiliensis]